MDSIRFFFASSHFVRQIAIYIVICVYLISVFVVLSLYCVLCHYSQKNAQRMIDFYNIEINAEYVTRNQLCFVPNYSSSSL